MRASRLLPLLALLASALPALSSDMSYMLRRGDRSYTVTGNMNLREIAPLSNRLSKRWSGDFLWVRKGGREYLIRDHATMDEARGAFVQVEALQDQYHALTRRMRPIESRHEAIERQIDAITDRFDEDEDVPAASERRSLEEKLHDLERDLEALEDELRVFERREEDLDQRQEKLEEEAERKLEQIIDRAIASGIAQRLD